MITLVSRTTLILEADQPRTGTPPPGRSHPQGRCLVTWPALLHAGQLPPVSFYDVSEHYFPQELAPPKWDLTSTLEVWPESPWPGFALREADVFESYKAW